MSYTWPDGSKNHTISWDVHENNLRKQAYDASKGNTFGSSFAPASPGSPAAVANADIAAAPVVTPPPFDPAFAAQQQGAAWNIATGDSEATWQRGNTAYTTGYNEDGTLNTSNPYSQAQLLEDNYRRSITGTNNSLASQGQYFSGARLNAQAHNDREYAQGSDSLRRGAANTYHGIGVGQLQTYGANSLGVGQGGYDSLHRSVYGG